LILNPLSFPIEQVKQPSPSVKPANQLSFKLGIIDLCFILIGFNRILPFIIQELNLFTKFSNFTFLLGKIILPLNK
jgi:hypothetical protein